MPFFGSYEKDIVAGALVIIFVLALTRVMGIWDSYYFRNRENDPT